MLIKDQSLIGQPVRAWINPRLVSGVSAKGKPYAFIVTNLLRDTYIESLNTAEPIKKVG
jgi:hypothetical protein